MPIVRSNCTLICMWCALHEVLKLMFELLEFWVLLLSPFFLFIFVYEYAIRVPMHAPLLRTHLHANPTTATAHYYRHSACVIRPASCRWTDDGNCTEREERKKRKLIQCEFYCLKLLNWKTRRNFLPSQSPFSISFSNKNYGNKNNNLTARDWNVLNGTALNGGGTSILPVRRARFIRAQLLWKGTNCLCRTWVHVCVDH